MAESNYETCREDRVIHSNVVTDTRKSMNAKNAVFSGHTDVQNWRKARSVRSRMRDLKEEEREHILDPLLHLARYEM